MKLQTDWNCHLLPMMGEWITAACDTLEALLHLNARTGIRRFCMMSEFDPEREPLPCFLIERDCAVREVRRILPGGFRIIPGGYVRFRQGVSTIPGLSRLCLPNTDLLPVLLPWNAVPQELAVEWNRMLYHSPYHPLLMEADRFLTVYPKDAADRLLRLQSVVYQFGFHSLLNPAIRKAIRFLLNRGATVLLGSGVNSPGSAAYFDFRTAADAAIADFGAERFSELLYARPV